MLEETEPLQQQGQDRYRQQTLMSSSLGAQPNANSDANSGENDDLMGSRFECNICLDDVREPIVTQCGHLFCWYVCYSYTYSI